MATYEEVNARISDLERKIRGVPLANARVAKLERELESLKMLANQGFNPSFVDSKLDKFEQGLADHEIRVSGLEAGFEVLESETTRAHARLTDLTREVGEDRKARKTQEGRISLLEDTVYAGPPFWVPAIAVILGVIGGLLWANIDWSSTSTFADQTARITNRADETWVAVIVGILVSGFCWGVIASIVSPRLSRESRFVASPIQDFQPSPAPTLPQKVTPEVKTESFDSEKLYANRSS